MYLGGGVELGMHKATTGNDVAQLMVRGGPVVAWNPIGDLYVEAVPEMQYLSANDGAITLGVSLRAGWRF